MSQTGPFIRVQSVSAPLKGSFPLDHEGTCKLEMLKYMCCLHEQKHQNTECREKAKAYFQCRMEHGLMDKDEWTKLGYGVVEESKKQIRVILVGSIVALFSTGTVTWVEIRCPAVPGGTRHDAVKGTLQVIISSADKETMLPDDTR